MFSRFVYKNALKAEKGGRNSLKVKNHILDIYI